MRQTRTYRVGADIGGTFTDLFFQANDGTELIHKVPSTPDDYGRAIVDGIREVITAHAITGSQIREVVHGTTIATNTILEGKGARTAFITTRGFRDVLELRRIRIPEQYNVFFLKPPALIPRRLRFEVDERMRHDGSVATPLVPSAARELLTRIADQKVEALAICLLHSYANPSHELALKEIARELLPAACFVTCSCELLPEIKEYERSSTTAINAIIGPVVRQYIESLRSLLVQAGIECPVRIMQSSGGVLSLAEVAKAPAYIVESGPVAGVIGAARFANRVGPPDLITIDMGGTTTKASLIEGGAISRTNEYEVGAGINISSKLIKGGGHALKLPVIDVSEIGAGGGSIAAVSEFGLLSVGPASAGATPGPAAYGKGGTQPTLTDAMIVLGYVNPSCIAGGTVRLDASRAQQVISEQIGLKLGTTLLEAAYGIYVVAVTSMTRAVKAISTFRGRDPRDFSLFAMGGNGALMAAAIADSLEMQKVIIPKNAGIFSAIGLLEAGFEKERSLTLMQPVRKATQADLRHRYRDLERGLLDSIDATELSGHMVRFVRKADLRYYGQAYELTIDVGKDDDDLDPGRLNRAFVEEHIRTYGHGSHSDRADIVNLRVSLHLDKEAGDHIPMLPNQSVPFPAIDSGTRDLYFGATLGTLGTPVITRKALGRNPISGPLVIEELHSTVLVPPTWEVHVDDSASFILDKKR